jgi:hypothetical protein
MRKNILMPEEMECAFIFFSWQSGLLEIKK